MTEFFINKKEKPKQKNTTVFTLKNINTTDIDKKYQLLDKLNDISNTNPVNVYTIEQDITSLKKLGISSLQYEPIITTFSKDKTKLQLYPVMWCKSNTLPETTDIPCFGCRRKYKTCPIGIPINYIKKDNRDCFEVDGMVCSFNCIKLHIKESPSPLYKNTPLLIDKLYFCIFGEYPKEPIHISPSWRQRKEYGGNLSDEEFEKSLQTIKFTDTHQVVDNDIYKLKTRIYEIEDVKNFS